MIVDRVHKYNENTDSIISSESKIIEGIIIDLRLVIDQLDTDFTNAKNLILELARRLDETKRCEQSQICRKIKDILQEKIKERKITEKWIAQCLPQEYKRTYTKRELCSLSRNAKINALVEVEKLKNGDLIAIDPRAEKSVLTTIDRCNTDNDHSANGSNLENEDEIEQGLDKELANHNTSPEDDIKYEALRSEIYELREALKTQTPMLTADQIFATQIEFTISKPKYKQVKAAMESSRNSISVTFDKNGILQRADSDTAREQN